MLATGVAGAAGASAPAGNFGPGPGGASAPAYNFGPGPGGAMAPAFFFGPGPGGAMAPAGPAPGPGIPVRIASRDKNVHPCNRTE